MQIIYIDNFIYFSEIGVGLAGFGISFIILGILLLFDKGLLAIGNVSIMFVKIVPIWKKKVPLQFIYFQILFLVGLGCVIGLQRTFRFFFQKHKAKASAAFFGGIFVVLLGWPLVGMIIETYGFVLLFR